MSTSQRAEELTELIDRYCDIVCIADQKYAYASNIKSSVIYEMTCIDTRRGGMDEYLFSKIKYYKQLIAVAEAH